MFLDEILVQMETDGSQKQTGRNYDEIKEEILRKEREQKPISEFILELNSGCVVIGEKRYLCEKRRVLSDRANMFLFAEDLAQLDEETNTVNVSYLTLEIACTLGFLQAPSVVKNETEYQKLLKKQLDSLKIPYEPVDVGNFSFGNQKIRYVSGITTNMVGGLFTINYYIEEQNHTLAGSFTCKLLERYTFEHLFMAMMQLLLEEKTLDPADQ